MLVLKITASNFIDAYDEQSFSIEDDVIVELFISVRLYTCNSYWWINFTENGDASRVQSFSNLNDDSNLGFSETGFESDSNATFEPTHYPSNNGSTDFSALRQQELNPSDNKQSW